ncbi:MAG: protein kinase [Planctomycetes bacterium]|nr:protein kinase [Planctomycetota bacterium]
MTDRSADIDRADLRELEERVAAILELPSEQQAPAFCRLREEYPSRAELLDRWEAAANAIATGPGSDASVSAAMRCSMPLSRPAAIGPYTILDVLGEGGMGTVYLAEQQRPLQRRVALKVIRAGMDTADVIARFEAERQALAVMSHPNIATVFDAGVTQDARPYFALEHVPGTPITRYCDEHRLDIAGRVRLFQKVCHGVQHAHQKGIIHRDLKPANILVVDGDGGAEPKIIDFGIAKALERRLTERTLRTQQGIMLGTPEYMSPEQFEASGAQIDTRSDIYSLGVLLYELLVGEMPIDATGLRVGHHDLRRRICEDEPVRPSTRCSTFGADTERIAAHRRTDPRSLARLLRGDLDWIVMRCLEKDPGRRYPSASELAADLQRHLDHEPVSAGPPSLAYRSRKFLRKHRGPVTAAVSTLLALIAGLWLAVWQYREATDNLQTAVANERRAWDAEQHIEDELRRSRAVNLALESERAVAFDPAGALLLALEAVDLDRSPTTLGCVQNALAGLYPSAELIGHTDDVVGADLGATSRRIVSGSLDGTVRVWTEDGEQLLVLPQGGPVVTVRFSRDERSVLTVASNGAGGEVARSYDLDGTLRAELGGEGQPRIESADWDLDGSRVLVGYAEGRRAIALLHPSGVLDKELLPASDGGMVHISAEGHALHGGPRALTVWPGDGGAAFVLATGPEDRFALRTHRADWRTIAFDPRGELVATVHVNGGVRLWSRQGTVAAELVGHSYRVFAVCFSPSGETIATASGDGTARLWTRDGHQTAVLSSGAEVTTVTFFGTDHRVLTRNGMSVELWNDKGRSLAEFIHADGTWYLDGDPSAGLVLTAGQRHTLSVWRLGGAEGGRLVGPEDRTWDVACRHTGEILASGEDGRAVAFDAEGRVLRTFDAGVRTPLYGIAVSPDGSLVVAGASGRLHGFDWSTGEKLWERELGRAPLTHVYFLARQGLAVVHSWPTVTTWLVDLEAGEHTLLADPRSSSASTSVGRVFVSTDRTLIAIPISDRLLRLCDASGTLLVDFEACDGAARIWYVALHRAVDRLAIAFTDGTSRIWKLSDVLRDPRGVRPERARLSDGEVGAIAFSPDGRQLLLAAAGAAIVTDLDGTERIRWRMMERASAYTPPAAYFSLDGKWIIGASFDGARRWPAHEDDLLRMAWDQAARIRRYRHVGAPGPASDHAQSR